MAEELPNITSVYAEYAQEFTTAKGDLDTALTKLGETIPPLNLPDFFDVLSQNYPDYNYSQEKTRAPSSPLDPAYDFDPAELWKDWTLTPESLRYDSAFLEQLEQKCRYIILDAHNIILGMDYNGVNSIAALFDFRRELDAREANDAVLALKSQFGGRGFPMPTHMMANAVVARVAEYRAKREENNLNAFNALTKAIHGATEYALKKGVAIEDLRSRLTLRFQAVYQEAVQYQLARYREAVEYASTQMRSAIAQAKMQVRQIEGNEEMNAKAHQDAVQAYEERYKRAYSTTMETFKAAEEDFNRRLDGVESFVKYYATYLSRIINANQSVALAKSNTE